LDGFTEPHPGIFQVPVTQEQVSFHFLLIGSGVVEEFEILLDLFNPGFQG
jgi:hypothetical protein